MAIIDGSGCRCYAPIRVGRGCMACMKALNPQEFRSTMIATMLARGGSMPKPPPMPMRHNRKQRRK